jgi:hypothetical protein
MASTWPTWDEWLATVDPDARARALKLRNVFADLGADDPEGWARSEVSEDIAQLARFIAVRTLWRDTINVWSEKSLNSNAAASRLLARGADAADLVRLARAAAYQAVFGVLYRLAGEGSDYELEDRVENLPGWRLMETVNDSLTGRDVGGLHESILTMDPSGNEGQDLWE